MLKVFDFIIRIIALMTIDLDNLDNLIQEIGTENLREKI